MRSHVSTNGVLLLVILLSSCASQPSDRTLQARETNERRHTARKLIDAGQYEAALSQLQPLLEKKIKHEQVYALAGESYWRLGDHELAAANFEQSLRLNHADPITHANFGALLMDMGRTGRALTEFELAVGFGPKEPVANYNFGLALYNLRQTERALGHLQVAHEQAPAEPSYAEALAMVLADREPARAEELFQTAEQLGSDSATFYNNYGVLLFTANKNADAARRFREAVVRSPGNKRYVQNLAASLMRLQRYEEATPLWQDVLSEDPQSRTARIYLGRALLEQQRFTDAIDTLGEWSAGQREKPADSTGAWNKFAETATVREPDLSEAYEVLGLAHRGLKQTREAMQFMEKAVSMESGNVNYLNNYGVVLAENGNIEKAKTQWRRVLEIDPENVRALANLSAVGGQQ